MIISIVEIKAYKVMKSRAIYLSMDIYQCRRYRFFDQDSESVKTNQLKPSNFLSLKKQHVNTLGLVLLFNQQSVGVPEAVSRVYTSHMLACLGMNVI